MNDPLDRFMQQYVYDWSARLADIEKLEYLNDESLKRKKMIRLTAAELNTATRLAQQKPTEANRLEIELPPARPVFYRNPRDFSKPVTVDNRVLVFERSLTPWRLVTPVELTDKAGSEGIQFLTFEHVVSMLRARYQSWRWDARKVKELQSIQIRGYHAGSDQKIDYMLDMHEHAELTQYSKSLALPMAFVIADVLFRRFDSVMSEAGLLAV